MSHGIEVYDASGNLTYSTADVTWNQVDFFFVSGGGTATKYYPVIDGREVLTAQILINAPPLDRRAVAHTIDVSGIIVGVYGGSEDAYILVMMR